MQTARARWAAAYREARKQARFIQTFSRRLNRLEPSRRTFPSQCPGFCFTRLCGDTLDVFGLRASLELRRAVLAAERFISPRLPA